MKILHVISSMNPKFGGPSQGIRNLEIGYMYNERHVVCFDSPDDVNKWENGDLIFHPLGQGKTSWWINRKFSKWLNKNVFYFDVIIINGLWLFHSYKTIEIIDKLKAKNKKTPKIFIMPHGMLDPWFQNSYTRRFKALRNEIYWKLVERNVVNSADCLLFTCSEELELARKTFKGYQPKEEINVGYGIKTPPIKTAIMDDFIKKIFPKLEKNKYWLFLGRIDEKKGIDLLIYAYKKILKEELLQDIPDLLIVGPGIESHFGQKVFKLVNDSILLKNKIHFVEMLKGDAKWGAIYNCEAFILPSHQENFGIAVAEALACSKPVLISNQVNIWKEIERNGAGFICDDTMESIVLILKKFYELKDSEKERMSNQALFTFKSYFNVEKTAITFFEALKN